MVATIFSHRDTRHPFLSQADDSTSSSPSPTVTTRTPSSDFPHHRRRRSFLRRNVTDASASPSFQRLWARKLCRIDATPASSLVEATPTGEEEEIEPPTLPRRVHFDVDDNNEIRTDNIHTYEGPSEEEKASIFMTLVEIKQLKADTKKSAANVVKSNRFAIQGLYRLYPSTVRRDDETVDPDIEEDEAIEWLANSDSRGLEVPMTKLISRHQKWARKSIVECYLELKKEQAEDSEELLRCHCMQVNQCPTEFALRLAQVDQMEAERIYSSDVILQIATTLCCTPNHKRTHSY